MTTSSYESLSHSKWDGKYHVVFIPKGRKKALYGKIRKFLGPVLRELAGQRGSTIVEGHMVQDHVHMLIRIPPKYAVAEVIGLSLSRLNHWLPRGQAHPEVVQGTAEFHHQIADALLP